MTAHIGEFIYLSFVVVAVIAAGHVLRTNGQTLLVSACPEGNRNGATAGMRLIVATFYLVGFGFVFLVASMGKVPVGMLAILQHLVMKLGSGLVLLGMTCAGAALAIQGVVNRAARQAEYQSSRPDGLAASD